MGASKKAGGGRHQRKPPTNQIIWGENTNIGKEWGGGERLKKEKGDILEAKYNNI